MTYRAYRSWHRCGVCRTRRATAFLLLEHKRQHQECKPCTCDGYPLRHRPGSSECKQHPRWAVFDAIRHNASDEEILEAMIETTFQPGHKPYTGECPF